MNYEWREVRSTFVIAGLTRNPLKRRSRVKRGMTGAITN
jgi:hypothetical protein